MNPDHMFEVKKQKWENALRWTINTFVVVLVGIAALLGWDRFFNPKTPQETGPSLPEIQESPVPDLDAQTQIEVGLPAFGGIFPSLESNITRVAQLDTEIPERPRVNVITYTVQIGDSIFSIADDFGLKPETLLWGNYETLKDNPHLLKTGQNLNILPVDGTYYEWHEDDSLDQVASFFKVDAMEIIEYPGNRFDLTETTVEDPGIEDGKWLIVPGGWRAIKDWGPPAITRTNPASAAYYGAGHCGAVYEGAIGTGTFVWPTTSRQISGYYYVPGVHPAVDIGGAVGNAIYATDSGVVVYAG